MGGIHQTQQSERWVHLKDTDGKLLPWVMAFPSGQNKTFTQTEKVKVLGSDLGLIFKFMGLVGELPAQLGEGAQKH